MNLKLVTGTPFVIHCHGCRQTFMAGNTHGSAVYADLDGAPWRAYYCALCAGDLRAANMVNQTGVAPGAGIGDNGSSR